LSNASKSTPYSAGDAAGLLGCICGCGDDSGGDPAGCIDALPLDCTPAYDPPTYDAIFDHLLSQRCGGSATGSSCHSSQGRQAGLVLEHRDEAYDSLLGNLDGVNRVVPGDRLRGSALEWAQRLAKGPTGAHAATKRLLRHALANGTRSADGYMSEVVPPLFVGHDLSAGVDYLLTHGVQKFRENHDEIVFIGE